MKKPDNKKSNILIFSAVFVFISFLSVIFIGEILMNHFFGFFSG